MPFSVTQKTLERLDWPRVLSELAARAATPRALARLESAPEALFEASSSGVRERLAETGEARALLRGGDRPPLGGVVELAGALRRAAKGGALNARELADLRATLAVLRASAQFLAQRAGNAPRLADLGACLGDHRALEEEIGRCLDEAGEVRDEASPALAEARREARQLAAEIQGRLDRILRDPDVAACLSDRYFTVRNDRYVLPVRADARGGVRGIVHDASGSGTTLYVEPEGLVGLNNRHKQAEIAIEHEIRQVLRRLSARAAEIAPALDGEVETLAAVDLAFARAHLAEAMDACAPEVGDEGVLRLPQLRHPSLPRDDAVPNDVSLGERTSVLVISGPNAGGKTVTMKAVALAVLFARAGLHVPCGEGARVDLFDAVLSDIGDEQDIRESLSTFSAHLANLARIVAAATPSSLVVLDEIGVGTDPGEGAALAQAVLETLADAGARVVVTTHLGLLKEMADADARFENASVDFDAETLAPTYRLRIGLPGSSSAMAVAARMGLPARVLERANAFLEREDRQLDRMLSDLASSRAALESEQREAVRLREETEGVRQEYVEKLGRLQERRDRLYRTLREDLDRGFRDAHAQIGAVIRDLQRGGTAQAAAHARKRLEGLEQRAREVEEQAGVSAQSAEILPPLDWPKARVGDAVRVAGGGRGRLLSLPDRHGRVRVGLGAARVTLAMDRIGRAEPAEPQRPVPPVRVERAEAGDAASGGRCDLRGLRVDEALDRLDAELDRATAQGRPRLLVVHGIGSGALRGAVRDRLRASRYVSAVEAAPASEGGDGATIAQLA